MRHMEHRKLCGKGGRKSKKPERMQDLKESRSKHNISDIGELTETGASWTGSALDEGLHQMGSQSSKEKWTHAHVSNLEVISN